MNKEQEALKTAQQFVRSAGFSWSKKRFSKTKETDYYGFVYTFSDSRQKTNKDSWYKKHEIYLCLKSKQDGIRIEDIDYIADVVKPRKAVEPLESLLKEVVNSNEVLKDNQMIVNMLGDTLKLSKAGVVPFVVSFRMSASAEPRDYQYVAKVIGNIDTTIALYFGTDLTKR